MSAVVIPSFLCMCVCLSSFIEKANSLFHFVFREANSDHVTPSTRDVNQAPSSSFFSSLHPISQTNVEKEEKRRVSSWNTGIFVNFTLARSVSM